MKDLRNNMCNTVKLFGIMSAELLLRSNEKGDKKQLLSLNSALFFKPPF